MNKLGKDIRHELLNSFLINFAENFRCIIDYRISDSFQENLRGNLHHSLWYGLDDCLRHGFSSSVEHGLMEMNE